MKEYVYIVLQIIVTFFVLYTLLTLSPRTVRKLYNDKRYARMTVYIVLQILLAIIFVWKCLDMLC